MVQHHSKHHPPRRRSWVNLLTVLLVAATTVLVVLQLSHTRHATGSRPMRMFGRRRLHQVAEHGARSAALGALLEAAEPHFVVFTSGLTPEGFPWCGDCAAAMPVIREIVLGAGGSLLEVSVGSREEWADRQHPLRLDPRCPVRYVPTLYHWGPDGCGASIDRPLDGDATEEELRLRVARFVRQTAAGKRYVDRITREVIESGGKSCGGC